MALYDNKFDWYDLFSPTSTIMSMGDAVHSAVNTVGSLRNDFSGVTQQQQFNAAEAQKQRNYETEMSNSAYSRAAADMRNAGLNTALMYGSATAGGASTPSATSAKSNIANSGDVANIVNSAANLIQAGSAAALNKAKLNQIASSASKVIKGFIG